MQKSLDKLFKTIDDLDGNNNIKEFYKETLLFEFYTHLERVPFRHIKNEYEKMINRHLEDE